MQAEGNAAENLRASEEEIAALAHQFHLVRGGSQGHDVDDWVRAENFLNQPKAIDQRSLEWMPKSVWGPIKWKELHTRGLTDLPMDHEPKWFATFVEGLPCAKCRCHFEAFLTGCPPDFSSRASFFEWTVRAHNHVNRALSKPEFTEAQAREEHRFTPDPPA